MCTRTWGRNRHFRTYAHGDRVIVRPPNPQILSQHLGNLVWCIETNVNHTKNVDLGCEGKFRCAENEIRWDDVLLRLLVCAGEYLLYDDIPNKGASIFFLSVDIPNTPCFSFQCLYFRNKCGSSLWLDISNSFLSFSSRWGRIGLCFCSPWLCVSVSDGTSIDQATHAQTHAHTHAQTHAQTHTSIFGSRANSVKKTRSAVSFR